MHMKATKTTRSQNLKSLLNKKLLFPVNWEVLNLCRRFPSTDSNFSDFLLMGFLWVDLNQMGGTIQEWVGPPVVTLVTNKGVNKPPIVKRGTPMGGGHQTHCTEMYSVAETSDPC